MKPFLAVCSNVSYDGYPPIGQGRPPLEASFETLSEARAWLRSRGGGAISTHRDGDWGVIEIVQSG